MIQNLSLSLSLPPSLPTINHYRSTPRNYYPAQKALIHVRLESRLSSIRFRQQHIFVRYWRAATTGYKTGVATTTSDRTSPGSATNAERDIWSPSLGAKKQNRKVLRHDVRKRAHRTAEQVRRRQTPLLSDPIQEREGHCPCG